MKLAFMLFLIIPCYSSLENSWDISLSHYQNGEYQKAMLGFMDILISEPTNEKAKEYLKKSGEMLIKLKEQENKSESKKILEDSKIMKEKLTELEKNKITQIKEWEKIFNQVKDRAQNPNTLNEAIRYYEYFLAKTPIYANLKNAFIEKINMLKQVFFQTINSKYSYLLKGKNTVDEIDLATVFFAQSAINDMDYRYTNPYQTEKIITKSNKIKETSAKILDLFDIENQAMDFYSREKYELAKEKFNEVLKYNFQNEEAKFYFTLANKYLTSDTGKKTTSTKQTEQYFKELLQTKQNLPQITGEKQKEPKIVTHEVPIFTQKMPQEKRQTKIIKKQPSPIKISMAKTKGADKNKIKKQKIKMEASGSKETSINNKIFISSNNTKLEKQKTKNEQKEELAEKLYEEGVIEFSTGNYQEAQKKWEECLQLNPQHIKAKLGLARIKEKN